MSYVDEIDAEIDRLRVQLVKLEHAREVMSKLEKRGPKTLELAAEKPVKKGPMYTISKKVEGPKVRKQPKMAMAELTELVRIGMADLPPSQAVGIGRHIGLSAEEDVKRIWYVLSILIKNGEAKKEGGLFSLIKPDEPNAVAAE